MAYKLIIDNGDCIPFELQQYIKHRFDILMPSDAFPHFHCILGFGGQMQQQLFLSLLPYADSLFFQVDTLDANHFNGLAALINCYSTPITHIHCIHPLDSFEDWLKSTGNKHKLDLCEINSAIKRINFFVTPTHKVEDLTSTIALQHINE